MALECSMKGKYVLVTFLLLLAAKSGVSDNGSKTRNTTDTVLHLLVIVSKPDQQVVTTSTKETLSVPKWERGHEILPGAHVAADEINNSSTLLNGYHLEITEVNVTLCNVNSGLVHFVENLLMTKNFVGIVGYFCNNIARTFSPLIGREKNYAIQISASTDYLPSQKMNQPYIHHLFPPLSVSAQALASLLKKAGWNRIGVLKTGTYHDTYYSKIAEAFTKLIGSENITYYEDQIETEEKNLMKLLRTGTKVVIGFLVPSDASEMICTAYHEGFTWPKYVWILVDIEMDDLHPTVNCDIVTLRIALEKVIIIHHYLPHSSEDVANRNFYKNYSGIRNNNYANVLYDSIWAFGLALNASLETINSKNFSLVNLGLGRRKAIDVVEEEILHLSFQGATGFVNFSQFDSAAIQVSIGLFQFQQGRPVEIGSYTSHLEKLTLNLSLLGEIPSDELDRMYEIYPVGLMVVLSALILLCLLLTTVILLLFVHYQAEPEIKAASRYLSLCMFLGCYTLLVASLDYTILSGIIIPQNNFAIRAIACVVDVTLSTIGLDLVLSTLFAKMLRIYHIFERLGKVSFVWSDKGLLVLIMLIVLIKAAYMIVWTSVDINNVINVEIYNPNTIPPHYTVIQKCHCKYFWMWYTLTFLYTGVLFIALLYVAFSTRKIEQANFNDSKKVNLLIAALTAVIVFSFTGWAVLQFIDNNASKMIVSTAFALTAVLCEGFLLVPKVVPPLRRYFGSNFKQTATTVTSITN